MMIAVLDTTGGIDWRLVVAALLLLSCCCLSRNYFRVMDCGMLRNR